MNQIFENLQVDLKQINPFVKEFRQIVELSLDDLQGGQLVTSAIACPQGEHERCYNLSVNFQEVSVLTDSRPHDLVITLQDSCKIFRIRIIDFNYYIKNLLDKNY